ncbi:vitamin K epoxide reductase family protein [Streptomyces spinosirectus]
MVGVVGRLASFGLAVEDWRMPGNPAYRPPCDIGPVIGCGTVMSSPEGGVFGFPSTLLGLGAFAAVAVLVLTRFWPCWSSLVCPDSSGVRP